MNYLTFTSYILACVDYCDYTFRDKTQYKMHDLHDMWMNDIDADDAIMLLSKGLTK